MRKGGLNKIHGGSSVLRFFKTMLAVKTVSAFIVLIIFICPANAGTTISLDKTIDVPDRTIVYQDKNYEIQDIGAYHIGGSC